MNTVTNPSLIENARHLGDNPEELENLLDQLSKAADNNAIDRVISLHSKTIKEHELKIWQDSTGIKHIEHYQNAFKIQEALHQLKTTDERYNFKIVIPVADRPQHLSNCLDSLLKLCENFGYGGLDSNNNYLKVSVLIADDSSEKENIESHKKICEKSNGNGISTEYFGLQQQIDLVSKYTADKTELDNIISSVDTLKSKYDFSHKGASIMRNITYLKLINNTEQLKNTLVYFIDSDQEFCINSTQADEKLYALNYFHYLNEIFKTQDVSILTGKVVGDPPVSPAVMASNFQQDVHNFISTIKQLEPKATCQFHHHHQYRYDDAAYHDMANLFGFSKSEQEFNYSCTLIGTHNNGDCFRDFSEKLSHFFYGEHPTRKTFFEYDEGFTATKNARTVYTGNYVIKPENLTHFIPFATLKLRMAGPVLGRILKSKLEQKFVSANLPMLHNRTVDASGQAEYRSGVVSEKNTVDLGDEFTRQFYGDIMLFSMIKITETNCDLATISKKDIQIIVSNTYESLKTNYIERHAKVLSLKSDIEELVKKPSTWWNDETVTANEISNHKKALSNIENFLNNIQLNFDQHTETYQNITSTEKSSVHLSSISDAIYQYKNNMEDWSKIIAVSNC